MIIKLPVKFDKQITIIYIDGTVEEENTFPSNKGLQKCEFKEKISGYDARIYRVTNLVGYNGDEFIKLCPKCGEKLSEIRFGYSGRNSKGGRRDQSQCNECRSC